MPPLVLNHDMLLVKSDAAAHCLSDRCVMALSGRHWRVQTSTKLAAATCCRLQPGLIALGVICPSRLLLPLLLGCGCIMGVLSRARARRLSYITLTIRAAGALKPLRRCGAAAACRGRWAACDSH
jgi:hypothetical protein